MKTKITLAMVMIIGFVLCSCSAVVAYYPAPIIRECPHCKAHVVQEEIVSGNTIGANKWTDGKRDAGPSLAGEVSGVLKAFLGRLSRGVGHRFRRSQVKAASLGSLRKGNAGVSFRACLAQG